MSRRTERQGRAFLLGIFVPFWLLLVLPSLVWGDWEEVTDVVEVRLTRPFYNFTAGISYFTASLGSNADVAYSAPVRLVIDWINPPEVTVRNAHGLTDSGLPYYDFSNHLGNGYLDPGEVSIAQRIELDNPRRLRFNISFVVEVEIPDFQNTPPTADAGPDRTPYIGDTVILDGSGSSDLDGDDLSFNWLILSKPLDSQAFLDDPGVVDPSFFIDMFGAYVVQLVVNDRYEDSAPDRVHIDTENSLPVADAGPDVTARVGDEVILDGSGSSDVDGHELGFLWSMVSAPGDSVEMLSDLNTVKPSFIVDQPGTYQIQLVVNDGYGDSPSDLVTVTTLNSPPVADAGPNQTVFVGDEVQLDGSGSSDADFDPLQFFWSLPVAPSESNASLSDPTQSDPTFQVDHPGSYVAQLIVSDGDLDSEPDNVTITTQNSPPVAQAGPNQTVDVGDWVQLDGSGSSDPDLDSLDYFWSLIAIPLDSLAALTDAAVVDPQFLADLPGIYVAQLIVHDGQLDSAPDSATVTVEVTNHAPEILSAPVTEVNEGEAYVYDVVAEDADGDVLIYTLDQAPLGMGIEITSGLIEWSPGYSAAGIYPVMVRVVDGQGGVDTQSFDVTVANVNRPPEITSTPVTTAIEGEPYAYDVEATDADGDALTFSLITAPAGMTIDAASGLIEWTPTDVQVGEHTVTVRVEDSGGLSATQDFVITVTTPNLPPVAVDDAYEMLEGEQLFISGLPTVKAPVAAVAANDSVAQKQAVQSYGRLPLAFEENQGQTDPRVKFLSRGEGYTLLLTAEEAVLVLKPDRANLGEGTALSDEPEEPANPHVLRLKLVGANTDPQASGFDALPGKSNYFIGNDPSRWRTNVPTYRKVAFDAIYPGIDLVYYGNQRQLEYDFVVAPGADPDQIHLAVEGADEVAIDEDGHLVLSTPKGEIRQHKPVVYQEIDGKRRHLDGRYALLSPETVGSSQSKASTVGRALSTIGGSAHVPSLGDAHPTGDLLVDHLLQVAYVGFEVSEYDSEHPLVIDPVLVYSTYLGGGQLERGAGIAVDTQGSTYIVGHTASLDFPTTAGAWQLTKPGGSRGTNHHDAFITKLAPDGSTMLYSTYLGGTTNIENARSVAVDGLGHAYVVGITWSADFPVTAGAYIGDGNAFVTKLDLDGSSLVYSSIIGGYQALDIALDASGNAYVTGDTFSDNIATTPGAPQPSRAGGREAYVAKLDPTGSSLLYATYLGGTGGEEGASLAVDGSGKAYITGWTTSSDFPLANPIQAQFGGGTPNGDAYVVVLNAEGTQFDFATYLGGTRNEAGRGIGVDDAGNAFVTGNTASSDFPLQVPLQAVFGGSDSSTPWNLGGDAFVTRIDTVNHRLVFSTYLGGDADDAGYDIEVDALGNSYVAGATDSADFPLRNPIQATFVGGSPNEELGDVFLAKINPAGSQIRFSTYLGGDETDHGECCDTLTVDACGDAYLTGTTFSRDFPTQSSVQETYAGTGDVFVTKVLFDDVSDISVAKSDMPDPVIVGNELRYTLTVSNLCDKTVTGVTLTDALPPEITLVSVASTQGTCNLAAGNLNCDLGELARFASAEVTLVTTVNAGEQGTILNQTSVAADQEDLDPSNNSATAITNADVVGGVLVNDYDPDGDPITAVWVDGPTHGDVTLNHNGTFTYIPAADFSGTDTFTYRANDGELNSNIATVTITITVQAVNHPPTITSMSVTEGTSGEPYAYDVEATDPDGDTLTYNLNTAPDGMTVDANTGLISWTPSGAQAGLQDVEIEVSDGRGGTDSQGFIVTVVAAVPVNSPPVITSTPETKATEGILYAYDVNAIDPDGDGLEFSLVLAPSGMTIDALTGLLTWMSSWKQAGTHDVTVKVSDRRGGFTTQTYLINCDEGTDLAIDNVDSRQLTYDGQALTVSGTISASVTNTGTTEVLDPFKVLFFEDIDHNGVYDAGTDTALGETSVTAPLLAGASMNVSAELSGSVLFSGNIVWGYVDSDQVITEVDETNNLAHSGENCTVPETTIAAANLTASYIRADLVSGEAGFAVRIGNGGAIAAPAGVLVKIYRGDPKNGGLYIGTVDTSVSLEPGYYQDVELVLPVCELLTSYAGANVITMDFNSPAAQGWMCDESVDTVDGEKLIIDTLGQGWGFGGGCTYYPNIDPLLPYTICLRTRVLDWEQVGNWSPSFFVAGYAGTERHGIWILPDQIYANEIGTVTTGDYTQFHDFRIDATPGVGFNLHVDRDFVDFIRPFPWLEVYPFDKNLLAIWDGSSHANTLAEITSYIFAQGEDVPVPPNLPNDIWAWVDDTSTGTEQVDECNEDDNIYHFHRNDQPVISSQPEPTAEPGVFYLYQVTANDPDGDTLTYSVISPPLRRVVDPDTDLVEWVGMTIDRQTGLLEWTPVASDVGSHSLSVKVSDGRGGFATQTFSIAVGDYQNHPPEITSIPIVSAIDGTAYTYDVEATDPNGDVLTYGLITAPSGMTINGYSGLIEWTPTDEDLGEHDVHVLVIDGFGGEAAQSFVITVGNVNRSPMIISTPLTVATAGQAYRYDVEATDPDGDTLSYSLTVAPVGMTIDANTGVISWTPVAEDEGTASIEVKVNDDRGGEAKQSYDMNVGLWDIKIHNIQVGCLNYDGQQLDVAGYISATVSNRGLFDIDDPIAVYFFEDRDRDGVFDSEIDNLLGQTVIQDPLDQGSSAIVRVKVAGDVLFYRNIIWGFADATGLVTEAEEFNNLAHSGEASRYFGGVIDPVIEWSKQTFSVIPASDKVYMTPVVADLNGDEIPEIVFTTRDTTGIKTLRAISGDDGEEVWSVTHPDYQPYGDAGLAIGDIDLDGKPEIVALHMDIGSSTLMAFEHDGTLKWKSEEKLNIPTMPRIDGGAPTIADLDQDGVPEIIFGAMVFNSDGTLRWNGHDAGGEGDGHKDWGALSAVADLDLDGNPEVVAGKSAYRSDGSLYWNAEIPDGFPALGNFDKDPFPEIVVVTPGAVYLLEHTGEVKWGPVEVPGASFVTGGFRTGGAPVVADFDGDSWPEIGVAGATRYMVLEADGNVKWTSEIDDTSSGKASASVFDFDGDGAVEIVYGDHYFLRLYRGADGAILYETPKTSDTVFEYPLVADVDADGQAEIVAAASNQYFGDDTGIFVYGSGSNSWTGTRSIWNQHTYHVTNVTDAGGIPLQEENSWDYQCTYRGNVSIIPESDSTPASNLTVSYRRDVVTDTETIYTVRIGNGGAVTVPEGVSVAIYDEYPHAEVTPLGETLTRTSLSPGGYEDVSIILSGTIGEDGWVWVDNEEVVAESNEIDNLYQLGLNDRPVILSASITVASTRAAYSYDVEAIDPNGDTLTYDLVSAPIGMTISNLSGLITWTPTNSDIGSHPVEVTVDDGNGGTDTQSYTIEVPAGNNPPTITSEPVITTTELGAYEYDVKAFDADLDPLTFSLTTFPQGMLIYPDSGLIRWIPGAAQVGEHEVVVQVDDDQGESDTQNFTVQVDINHPPMITSDAVTNATEGLAYEYDVEAFDPDDDPLTFSLSMQKDCLPPPSDQVAWLPGDGSAVEKHIGLVDGWQYEYNGVSYAPGLVGDAFLFDGDDDIVLVPNNTAYDIGENQDFTIDVWVKLQNPVPGKTDRIFSNVDVGSGRPNWYLLRLYNDTHQVGFGLLSDSIHYELVSDGVVPLSEWTHIAVVRRGENGFIFINGKLDTRSGPEANVGIWDPDLIGYQPQMTGGSLIGNAPLVVGAVYDTRFSSGIESGYGFGGLIDEIEIHRRALTEEEIRAIHEVGPTGKCKTSAGLPEGTAFDPATGLIAWTPSAEQTGRYYATAEVADGRGGKDVQVFSLDVDALPNNPPEIISAPSEVATEGELYTYDVDAVDPDGDTLSYRLKENDFAGPTDVAVDADGNLIVADPNAFGGAGAIFRVDPTTGDQTIVSMGGDFVYPIGIATEQDGNLIVVDQSAFGGSGSVIRVDSETGAQTIVSSGGSFVTPTGVAVAEDGTIIVTDGNAFGGSGGVIAVDPVTGDQTEIASGGDFRFPTGIAIGLAEQIYVIDRDAFYNDGNGGGVFEVDTVTGGQTVVSTLEGLLKPWGIEVAADGGILVTDNHHLRKAVYRIDPVSGDQSVVSLSGNLSLPFGIAVDDNGKILVADFDALDGAVIEIDPDGSQTVVSPARIEGMAIDETTGLITWTPTAAQIGDHEVTVRVEDGKGGVDTQSYSVSVTGGGIDNHPPVITSTPALGAAVEQPYRYQVVATDPDVGDVLTFSLPVAPAGISIDPAGGIIQFTPNVDQIGTHSVTVRVTDRGGLSAEQSFVVIVSDTPIENRAPVAVAGLLGEPGLPACVAPPGGMIAWYPGDSSFDDTVGMSSPTDIIGNPQFVPGNVGQAIKFDGTSALIVANNPTIDFQADESFSIDAWVRVDGRTGTGHDAIVDKREASDGRGYYLSVLLSPSAPEGTTKFYSVIYQSHGAGIFGAITTRPVPLSTYHHVAIVVDRFDQAFSIYLNGVLEQEISIAHVGDISNLARMFIGYHNADTGTFVRPLIGQIDELEIFSRALSQQEIQSLYLAGSAGKCKLTVGGTVTLDGTGSTDADGDLLTYSWAMLDVPDGSAAALIDPAAAQSTFVVDMAGVYRVQLVVNDGQIDSMVSEITLQVSEGNLPSIALDDAYSVRLGDTLNMPAPGVMSNDYDPNGTLLTVTKVSDPFHGTLMFTDDGALSYTPDANLFGPGATAHTVIGTAYMPGQPKDIAIDARTNRIYVTNLFGNSLAVIDGATGKVINILRPVDSYIEDVAINPVTNHIYITGPRINQYIGGTTTRFNGVYVYDETTHALLATVPISGMQVEDVAVNPTTDRIYVASLDSGSVSVIYGPNNALIATIPVGTEPRQLTVDPHSNRVFALSTVDGTVTLIDGATNSVFATVAVGADPRFLLVDEELGRVYVTSFADGSVAVIDQATNAVIDTISVGAGPQGMALDPTTGLLYVANSGDDSVTLIDRDTGAVVSIIAVGAGPESVSVNPLSESVYVANRLGDTVSVIDAATGTLSATVPVGHNPATLAVNPITDRVYTVDAGSHTVSVIHVGDHFTYKASDGDVDSNVATVTIAIEPESLAPKALDDYYRVDTDGTPDIPTPGVLGNDAAISGNPLTAVLVSGPASGSLTLSADGSFTYTPVVGFSGSDTFTYKANDGNLDSNVATVTILVQLANRAPSITSIPPGGATVGALYSYDVEATDPDGDILTYLLPTKPDGMTIDPASGLIQWTPTAGQLGDNAVMVQVDDGRGGFATQGFTLTVVQAPPVNAPPVITSDAITTARTRQLYSYDVQANDPNLGDTLTYSLDTAPEDMTINPPSGLIQWVPTDDQVDDHNVKVRVTDDGGLFDTQDFTITVAPGNRAPDITSEPPGTARVGLPYTYAVEASDPDAGDTLAFFLDVAPEGMTIDPASGLVQWTPTLAQVGSQAVTVRVQDQLGAGAIQSLNVLVAANQPPVITSTPVTGATAELGYSYDVEANDPDAGDPLAYSLTTAPVGMAIDPATGLIQWTPTEDQVGDHPVTVRVEDPFATAETQDFTVTVAAVPPPVPDLDSIRVTPEAPLALTGQAIDFAATGILADGTSQGLAGLAIWESSNPTVASIDANGRAITAAEGSTTITARIGAVSGSALPTVVARIPNGTPPAVEITTPADGATVTGPVPVIGTAADPELLKYVLDIAPVGTADFTTIAEGTTSITNGELGTLDPTLLFNDLYTLRLRVYDRGGFFVQAETQVQVTREQKVGNFTLAFQDVSVPMACMPITVTRVYDSRDKGKGDFGVGWRLDVQTLRLRESGTMGKNWAIDLVNESGPFGIQIPTYVLYDLAPHKVSLTLPGGQVEEFDLTPQPSRSQWNPIFTVTPVYTPRPGTLGSLAAEGTGTLDTYGATGHIDLYDADLETFDPRRYRYTTPEGNVYLIDKYEGAQEVQCTNGQTLTFTPEGIEHSGGKGAVFTRDGQGRITAITDPAGNVHAYAYDANGDLVSYTDPETNATGFKYDYRHGMLEIIDPRGVSAIRNEYDEAGRLISTTDPKGSAVTFNHDLVARIETVTDRLGNATDYEYDEAGNVLRETDALGNVTTHTYDAFGNELTRIDPLGRITTMTYDLRRNMLSETDPLGNTTAYTYNALNAVRTITDPLGRVTTNDYDVKGNLLTTTDPLGNTTSHDYDDGGVIISGSGNLLTTTDALGNITGYGYDRYGNLTKETDALGNETTYTYDTNGNRLTETHTRTLPGGVTESVVTWFEYDANNRLVKTTRPDASTTRTEYNAIGKQVGTIDALGRETRYEYDEAGRLLKTTYPDGSTETSTYDAEGRRLTSTDRAGRVTSYSYDALGRLVQTTFPDGTITGTSYDATGQVVASTDALGNVNRYEYDPAGRRTRVIGALGNETTFTYDAAGNQTLVTNANGNSVQFEYDNNNRRRKTIHPDGTFNQVAYDAVGRQISKTDQAGVTTQYEYDALGRLVKVIDALGQETSYGYDEQGNQVSQTDANGNATTFAYDALGRRVSRTLPLGMTETMDYNAVGNLTDKTDFNGRTSSYVYDTLNRPIEKRLDPATGEPVVRFTYTASGQRASMEDARGTTTYAYDTRNRLIEKATSQGTLSYEYDAAGNLLSIQSGNPGGADMTYTYDALNRLSSVTDANGATSYTYDAVGNLQSYTYPNGVEHSYTYNALNRLTDLQVTSGAVPIASYVYTLGPSGNRLSVAELSGRRADYSYDGLYRLIDETVSGDLGGVNGTVGYDYDPVGNRLARTSTLAPVPDQTFGYDANDRITTETYDDNGNTLETTEGHNFGYDSDNRLVGADGGVSFVYDGDGNRVSRTVGSVTAEFLVDTLNPTGYSQVLEEIEDGSVVRRYTYGLDLVSQEQSSGVSFYGYDGHGSVRLLTDVAGSVTDGYGYDAFGNLSGRIGTTENAYLYSGEQRDSTIDTDYLRARYLNTQTGRFNRRDPLIGQLFRPISQHSYQYADLNPVSKIDPSGQISLPEISISTAVQGVLRTVRVARYATSLCKARSVVQAFEAAKFISTLVSNLSFAVGVNEGLVPGFKFSVPVKKKSAPISEFSLSLDQQKKLSLSMKGGTGSSILGEKEWSVAVGYQLGRNDPFLTNLSINVNSEVMDLSNGGATLTRPLYNLTQCTFDVGKISAFVDITKPEFGVKGSFFDKVEISLPIVTRKSGSFILLPGILNKNLSN